MGRLTNQGDKEKKREKDVEGVRLRKGKLDLQAALPQYQMLKSQYVKNQHYAYSLCIQNSQPVVAPDVFSCRIMVDQFRPITSVF